MALIRYAQPGLHGDKEPEPNLSYEYIPKERYTSKEFMKLEWDHIWTKIWLRGGLSQDLKEANDYITTEIGNYSILITRGEDMKARAFYNVCKHRGNTLAQQKMGKIDKTFKCSYHRWQYDAAGQLVDAPDPHTFPQGVCDPSLHLTELPCEEWNGWIMYSLNPDVRPLDEWLGPVKDHLEAYNFDKMDLVMDMTVEWNCNWKASVDAFNETYHVWGTHPQLMDWLDDQNVQIDLYDIHNRYLVPFGVPSPRPHIDQEVIGPNLEVYMEQNGVNPKDFKGNAQEARRAIQLAQRERADEMGWDFSSLNDDQLSDDYHYCVFPNVTLNTHATNYMMFTQRPHTEDPNKCLYDLQMFSLPTDTNNKRTKQATEAAESSAPSYMTVDGDEAPRVNPGMDEAVQGEADASGRPEHIYIKDGEEHTLGEVLDQDAHNLPFVQKGMNSPAYRGLWCGEQERRIIHFHQVVDRLIMEGGGQVPNYKE